MQYQCPECGVDIQVEVKNIGKIIHCPHCTKRVFLEKVVFDRDGSAVKTVKMDRCQHCGRPVLFKTGKCKHCGKDL